MGWDISVEEDSGLDGMGLCVLSYPCFSPFLCTGGSTQDVPERGLRKCGAYIAMADCCRLHTNGQHGTTWYVLIPFANYLFVSYPA